MFPSCFLASSVSDEKLEVYLIRVSLYISSHLSIFKFIYFLYLSISLFISFISSYLSHLSIFSIFDFQQVYNDICGCGSLSIHPMEHVEVPGCIA